jgi:hypothetical protein
MTYALIVSGVVSKYPYTFEMLRADNPQVSFSRNAVQLTAWGVVEVAPSAKPAHDPLTQNVIEGFPTLINGVWTQEWAVSSASAAEITARQRAAADAAATAEVKADAFITNFVAMTPNELKTYITNNSGTLIKQAALIEKLALMLLILARQGLR